MIKIAICIQIVFQYNNRPKCFRLISAPEYVISQAEIFISLNNLFVAIFEIECFGHFRNFV